MFHLQMWLQLAGVHHDVTLHVPSLTLPTHRDASRRHYPTPATPFV
jgi:hypothetical protein